MRALVRAVLVTTGLFAAVSCGKKEEKAAAPAASPTVVRTLESQRADITALVNRWADVQNQGVYKAYEELYAAYLHAERPDGMFMRSYDRVAWMNERSQLAVAPTKLSINNVRVTPGLAAMYVDFDQVFDHFEFKESGEKRLIFVREGDGWKIAYDVPAPPRPYVESKGANKADLSFVVYSASKSYVILQKGADPSWALDGAGGIDNAGSVFIAVAPTGPALPAQHDALRGKAFEVLTHDGQRCQTKIARLALLTAVDPPQAEIDLLTGKAGTAPKPADAAHVYLNVARPAERFLVGEVEGCDGPLAFTPGTKLSFKKIGPEIEVDLAELEKAVAGVPPVQELQESYTRFYGGYPLRKPWFTEAKAYSIEGAPELAVVIMRGSGEAADWYGAITVLVSGVDKKALRVIGASPFDQPPTMLLDLGIDGSFEIYSRAGEVYGDVVRPTRDHPAILTVMRPNLFQ